MGSRPKETNGERRSNPFYWLQEPLLIFLMKNCGITIFEFFINSILLY